MYEQHGLTEGEWSTLVDGDYRMTDVPETPSVDAPSEPLINTALITGVLTAGVALAVSFGLHLSNSQRGWVATIIGLVAPVLVGLIGRSKVFSPLTVRKMVLKAKQDG